MTAVQSAPCLGADQQHRALAFDGMGETYDKSVGWDEAIMGISLLRWSLAAQATGRVLEASAGTGRNIAWYDDRVKQVVFTDVSYDMLKRAKLRWEERPRRYDAAFVLSDVQALTAVSGTDRGSSTAADAGSDSASLRVHQKPNKSVQTLSSTPAWRRWFVRELNADAQELPAQPVCLQTGDAAGTTLTDRHRFCFPEHSFDTVVDTFGLCSCANPVEALRQMSRVVKPDGKILLLEHGRSTWTFLNNILDQDAAKRYEVWGCWWNRELVDAVEQAGLQIESCSRWHFGTTVFIVARPPSVCVATAS